MDNRRRDYIDRLINIWIDSISSISKDAGWEGDSILSRMIDYGGQIPRATGNDQSNMSMIHAIRLLRSAHRDTARIAAIMVALLQEKPDKIYALIARHYYHGINEKTDRIWTDEFRAPAIRQNLKTFQANVSSAYKLVDRDLTAIQNYEDFVLMQAG